MTEQAVDWNVANITTLTSMWADGFSSSVIAAKIRYATRSAIIGKIHRLKLPHPAGKRVSSANHRPRAASAPFLAPPPAPRLRNGHDPSQRRNPSHNIEAAIAIAGSEPGLPKYLEEPAVGSGLQLIELTRHTCRWPFGDPLTEQFYFCGAAGADVEEKRPYCPFHSRKNVDRTSLRSPRAFEKSALHASN